MLRGLYRFYLYMVFIAMLLFATFGVQRLIQTVLAQSIFKDQYSTPGNADLVQAMVFAVVSLVTAALFGGLHYWLIRRDMHQDPTAGSGGIRAFFLNVVEAISLLSAVGTGARVISELGQQSSGGASYGAAYTITFLGLWALLEWERRRSQAGSGAASVFQRLHLYGTQLILLFILTFTWLATVGLLVDDIFFGGKGSGQPVCAGFTVCQGPNLLSQIVGTLWVALFWIGYSFLSRNDTTSLLRRVLHFISFGYGMIAILVGIYRGVSLLLLSVFKVATEQRSISGPFAQYDIISPLTLGVLVAGVYLLWLRNAARKQPAEQASVSLTAQAIAAAFLGASFWYGCGLLLLNFLESAIPSNIALTPGSWATAIALIVTGIGYIPMDILLRRRSAQAAFKTPLRGFVFTLFGGGILAGAIGGASALYAYGTSLLGSPFNNWQYVAHAGFAAFAIGVIIVGLYLWTSIRERFFSTSSKEQGPSRTIAVSPDAMPAIANADALPDAPTTVTPLPIAEILDELLTGKINRDEAIARIESLVS